MIFLGVTAVACLFCLFFNRHLPTIDIICACWTGLGIIVILKCLFTKAAAGRHSISFALEHFDSFYSNNSPTELWIPGWWSFVIGLWPPVYTYAVIGMITNMAEEVHNPSEILPKAIAWSIPIGTLSGGIFLLPIIFTFPLNYNLAYDYMETEIDVTSIFTSVMGSRAGGFGL